MDSENNENSLLATFYSYYNFFLMTSRGRGILAVVAVAGVAYVLWKNQNDKKKSYGIIKDATVKSWPESQNEIYQKLQREIQWERERSEVLQREAEAKNEQRLRRMAEKRSALQQKMQVMGEINKEDDLIFQKKQMEADVRMRKLMDQRQMEQMVKDVNAKFEDRQLKMQGKRALEAIQAERLRSRELHQRNADWMDERFEENRRNYQQEDVDRQGEMQQQKEMAEQRRREIEERMERELEELRRSGQERKEQMDEQLHHIRRIMQMKVWNEVIESNWARRLNDLRSSHRDIEKSYSQMKKAQNQEELLTETQTRNVLAAVAQQKTLMEREKQEMDRMYSEHGKSFLLDIKDSVDDVSSECDRLTYVLKNEPSNTRRIEECFSALSRVTMSIPTLAELKARYKEAMQ